MADNYPGALDTYSSKTDGVDFVQAEEMNAANNRVILVETELGTDPAGTATNVKTRLARALDGAGNIDFTASTVLTIAAGSITPTMNWHRIETESTAATDDLDTIVASSLSDGFLLFIRPTDTTHTVVLTNSGNIVTGTGGNITLDDNTDAALLIYDINLTKWLLMDAGISALKTYFDTVYTVTASSTVTLTNKRITPRVTSEASSATPTINTDNTDIHRITALAAAITSLTENLSGTPSHGDELVVEFLDNGTARAITHGASFRAGTTSALLTTTVLSKLSREKFMWDSVDGVWDCVATWTEA